ncbi:MAG: hypothetical protein ACOX9R_19870 [Armatimonadota bacterium]|jgi:hypothetical protein
MIVPRAIITGIAALALLVAGVLGGCARGGEGESIIPQTVIEFSVTFAGPVQDAFYYFIALDADGDFGADGPLPVAAGPNWGNGWGTGSMTHYVEYHQGRYELFEVTLQPELTRAGGGITGVSGVPETTDAGVHAITIDALNSGAATLSGDGAIAAVTNQSLQAAGALEIATNAAGEVVAGSVSWTPAGVGGRELTAAEQAQIDALNAGGVALAADSLGALGLALTISAGPDLAGAQSIEVAQSTAGVTDRFEPEGVGRTVVSQSTLPANNARALEGGPLPGMTIVTGDLVVGETARIRLEPSPVGNSLGFPYESTLPQGGSTLRVTIDLSRLGQNVRNLSVNFIATTELIFDPTVVNPNQNTYDALGRQGNDYVTFVTDEVQTIENGDLTGREEAGDPTLEGPASEQERAAVDIVDWRVNVRRLR